MGDKLPREIENPLYRYLIAISKLRLGILTEQGKALRSLFLFLGLPLFIYLFIYSSLGR